MIRLPLVPTTVVGSTPQPDWLVDRVVLTRRLPPRVREISKKLGGDGRSPNGDAIAKVI